VAIIPHPSRCQVGGFAQDGLAGERDEDRNKH